MRRFATIWLALVMALAAGHALPSATVVRSGTNSSIVWVHRAAQRTQPDHQDLQSAQSRRKPAHPLAAVPVRRPALALSFSLFQRPPPPSASV